MCENPWFPGYPGASTIPEIPKSWQISENTDSTETLSPRNFSPRTREKFLGGKFLFSKGLACGNLPEVIDLSRIPRLTNKKSMISGIFGKSFISRKPGSLNYPRNPGIWTNLRNPDTTETLPPRNISPEKLFSVSGKKSSGKSFCFQKVFLVEISQKSLICPEFRDWLTRDQGFREYLESPSFPGYPGASTIPEIAESGQIWEIQTLQKLFPPETSPPRNFSPKPVSFSGKNCSGKSFCFQKVW